MGRIAICATRLVNQWSVMKWLVNTFNTPMMKTVFLDIFLHERFVCTLKYKFLPCFTLTVAQLSSFVEKERPSLKGKPYRIVFDYE